MQQRREQPRAREHASQQQRDERCISRQHLRRPAQDCADEKQQSESATGYDGEEDDRKSRTHQRESSLSIQRRTGGALEKSAASVSTSTFDALASLRGRGGRYLLTGW